MDNIAIIVGAGFGKRFGSFKQTEPIYGKAVYKYSLDAFISAGIFSKIYLVLHSELIKTIKMEIENSKYKNVIICEGGDTRSESVYKAFKKIKHKNSKVFVHDVARPLISSEVLIDLSNFSKNQKAVVIGKKINDTVRSVKNNYSEFTVDRTHLWTTETPQVFDYDILSNSYHNNKSINEFTDEAAIVENAGHKVQMYVSQQINTKITNKSDLKTISKIMKRDTVYGIGLDFHTLVDGSGIILGGHKIDCQFKSEAHSDGDVLTHAVIDALCGAMNIGDIGQHFPNTDEFLNISSIELLKKILKLIPTNISIVNIDASIVLNEPKISPHLDKIVKSLSSALDIPVDLISIKGTTTNGLKYVDMKNGWGAEVIIVLRKWS
jgi:2-C-methyl-D-erythritol 4-phosphate cytidylyltransferase/2-C-methyl-D-erythritol 2,4-cyclodiphosphate synthase|tara:strand:+ start:7591 stop:8727 length:1137 start_codon:yes stop_codon:yes gene_type:complete